MKAATPRTDEFITKSRWVEGNYSPIFEWAIKLERELAEAKREIDGKHLRWQAAEKDITELRMALQEAEQRLAEALELLKECRGVMDTEGFDGEVKRIDVAIAQEKKDDA